MVIDRLRSRISFYVAALLVILFDQVSKLLVRIYLPLGSSIPEEGFFRFTYVTNSVVTSDITKFLFKPVWIITIYCTFFIRNPVFCIKNPCPAFLLCLPNPLDTGNGIVQRNLFGKRTSVDRSKIQARWRFNVSGSDRNPTIATNRFRDSMGHWVRSPAPGKRHGEKACG